MYLGHVGIALGVKGVRRDIAFLVLLVATYASDWVDSGLCIAGAYDRLGMLSHSLPAVAVLTAIAVAGYGLHTRDLTGGLVVAGVVISHMLLDMITGYKPTWPGGPVLGLGLYAHPVQDFVLESLVLIGGVALYARSLPVRRRPWIDVALMACTLILMQGAVTVVRALTVALPKC